MPEPLSGLALSRRLFKVTADADVDRAWMVGCLLQTLAQIVDGSTADKTPAEYARFHVEQLIADAEAGVLPKVVRGQ